MVLPFALMLGCIAILPLTAAHFWESNRNKAIVAAVLSVPTALYVSAQYPAGLAHSFHEYISFIALLGSLYGSGHAAVWVATLLVYGEL